MIKTKFYFLTDKGKECMNIKRKLIQLKKVQKHNLISISLMAPILMFVFVFSIYPIVDAFVQSFKIQDPLEPKTTIGIDNYKELLLDRNFTNAIQNSAILFFVSSPIALLSGFLIALLLDKLSTKISKNFFITAFYSQFFISAFAIGLSFTFLFGEKNMLSKILGINFSFGTGKKAIDLIWLYVIYQLWRAIPFNTVLFFFAISSINNRYRKNFAIDKLSLWDKVVNLYLKEIGVQFIVIAYTNFIFATMLYPPVITGSTNLNLHKGHTLTSYIIDSSKDNLYKRNAASFVSLLFLIAIFSSFIIFNPKMWVKSYSFFKKITKVKRV